MSDFPLHTPDTAPDAAKPILAGSQKAMGFVPNLFAAMATAPAALEAYATLRRLFDTTALSDTERQIVLMVNNLLNGCHYCMAAHTTIAQKANVPADVIESLRTNTPIADPKLEALRTFAAVINETRGNPSEDATQGTLRRGLHPADRARGHPRHRLQGPQQLRQPHHRDPGRRRLRPQRLVARTG